jgi:N-acetylmuramic acid 6-phosphate (MurNAc-6-P) etherase
MRSKIIISSGTIHDTEEYSWNDMADHLKDKMIKYISKQYKLNHRQAKTHLRTADTTMKFVIVM